MDEIESIVRFNELLQEWESDDKRHPLVAGESDIKHTLFSIVTMYPIISLLPGIAEHLRIVGEILYCIGYKAGKESKEVDPIWKE